MSRKSLRTQNSNTNYMILGIIIVIVVLFCIYLATNDNNVAPYVEPYKELIQNITDNVQPPEIPTNDKTFREFEVTFEKVNETVYPTITLNIREQPNLNGKVILAQPADSSITRIGIGDNGWDKIILASGTNGYAKSEYLTTKKAKVGSNSDGLPIAESTGVSTSNTKVDLTHYTTNTLKEGISEKQADSFFSNAVFFGDSVTLGFEWYCDEETDGFLGGFKVFGTGSYGLGNALKTVNASSIHPIYKGYQTQLWNLTKELKVDKVFMMFGLNDIGLYGVEDSIINYKTLIDKIYEVNPNVKIYLLSTTPLCEQYQLQYLNNSNIRKFNNLVRQNADSWNVEYIDVASYLMDNNGYLKSNFVSDGKYHLMYVAYDEWVKVLRSYASYHI